jgi:hypothetical protein
MAANLVAIIANRVAVDGKAGFPRLIGHVLADGSVALQG